MNLMRSVLLLVFVPLGVTANPGEEQLLRESYQSQVTGEERDYYVYLPRGFAEREIWPVLLFLHGNGERGNAKSELEFVMAHGPLYEAWVQKRDLPFVIIAPQLPMYEMGDVSYIRDRKLADVPRRLPKGTPVRPRKFATDGPMDGKTGRMPDQFGLEDPPSGWPLHADELIEIVDAVIDKYRGDSDRVYLTGLSYGGFGTWYMASQYAGRFAAAVPIAGFAHPDLVPPIAAEQLPVWCFAGGRDPAVPVEYFYEGMNRLEQLGSRDVRFTVEEDMGHDVWTRVYAGEDVYSWMLSHAR